MEDILLGLFCMLWSIDCALAGAVLGDYLRNPNRKKKDKQRGLTKDDMFVQIKKGSISKRKKKKYREVISKNNHVVNANIYGFEWDNIETRSKRICKLSYPARCTHKIVVAEINLCSAYRRGATCRLESLKGCPYRADAETTEMEKE